MSVLLLGAGEFIGRAAADRLRARGVEAFAARRSAAPGHVSLDREDPAAVRAFVRERGVHAVVDVKAMTLASTQPLLDALAGEIARYVLVGSCDVYRNYGGLHRREPTEPLLDAWTEDAPLRASRFPYRLEPPRGDDDPERWLDDYDKIPIEEAARAAAVETAVVRLPMVYGPGDAQRRFGWIIHRLAAGRERIVVDRRWAEWRTTYGYVDDVGEALALAALHPAAAGRTFHVGEQGQPDHLAWIGRFAEAMGRTARPAPVEPDALPHRLRRSFDAVDLRFPLLLESTRIRETLGWREVVDPAEALRRTVDDELARGLPPALAKDMAAEDEMNPTWA